MKQAQILNTLRVISGFPGVGKSTMIRRATKRGVDNILDSDSSTFDKAKFPANYLKHIKEKTREGYDILCSSHADVRAALQEEGIIFALVYPAVECKEEYLQRYTDRGSPKAFIKLLDDKWDEWVADCKTQTGCYHVELNPGDYIPSPDDIRGRIASGGLVRA